MGSYYYKRTEPALWTVGANDEDGVFQPDSDHSRDEDAARRVRWLNGGNDPDPEPEPVTTVRWADDVDRGEQDERYWGPIAAYFQHKMVTPDNIRATATYRSVTDVPALGEVVAFPRAGLFGAPARWRVAHINWQTPTSVILTMESFPGSNDDQLAWLSDGVIRTGTVYDLAADIKELVFVCKPWPAQVYAADDTTLRPVPAREYPADDRPGSSAGIEVDITDPAIDEPGTVVLRAPWPKDDGD